MAIQFVDKYADAVCNLPEPYVITSSNNQFSIAVDGGSNQVVTLTSGTRTAAQIVTDLAGLTGCTASVMSQNGINYVRIRDASANGTSSTILFNAPSNNSNAILGFTATTYTGGANVCYQFLADTAQHINKGVEQGLNNAGWITISGHQSTPCVVQSACTPPGQNLRMQIKMTVNGSNVTTNIQNVSGSVVATNTNIYLAPFAGQAYSVLADRYQAWIYINGVYPNGNQQTAIGSYISFGVPYIPSFLNGILFEAIWLDSCTGSPYPVPCFRANLCKASQNGNYYPYWAAITNGNLSWNGQGNNGNGQLQMFPIQGGRTLASTAIAFYRYHDLSALMCDPLIGWGTNGYNDEGTIKGQLWDSFLSTDWYMGDTVITSVDGANWHAITHNNIVSGNTSDGGYNGTIFIVTPETATP